MTEPQFRSEDELKKLPDPTDDWWFNVFNASSSVGGQTVNSTTAQRVAAVYACTTAISESVAMLPTVIYSEESDRRKIKVKDHTLYKLLRDQPNQFMDSFSFFESLQTNLLDSGNAYAFIDRKKSGAITALTPLNSDSMTVKVEDYKLKYEYQDPNGQKRAYGKDNIFHIKYRTKDGLVGRSPIKLAAETIGHSLAIQKHGNKIFENGGFLSGFLTSPYPFKDDEARERFMTSFNKYLGANNAGKFGLLEQGVDFKPYSMNNQQAQLLEILKFSVLDIARIYRVPPLMIQVTESGMSYASIEQLAILWVQYSIQPWVVRYERAIKSQLLNDVGEEDYFARMNVSSLIRGDLKSRTESVVQQLQYGLKTINEARDLLDENAIDHEIGDEPLLSHNLIPARNVLKVDSSTLDNNTQQPNLNKKRQFEPLFKEILGRFIRQEVSAAKKQSKKDGFIKWAAEEFLPKQEERMKESLTPAIIAYRGDEEHLESFLQKYIAYRQEELLECQLEAWQDDDTDYWVSKILELI